jgi:hypothetical protein
VRREFSDALSPAWEHQHTDFLSAMPTASALSQAREHEEFFGAYAGQSVAARSAAEFRNAFPSRC